MNWIFSILIFLISLMMNWQPLDEAAVEMPSISDSQITTAAAAEVPTEELSVYSVNVETVEMYEEEQTMPKVIVIGDSRTVCMYCSMTYSEQEYPGHVFYHISPDHSATYENTLFSAKGGEGYSWFSVYGAALGVSNMDENTVFVVWLGVNDLHMVNQYIEYINYTLLPFGAPVYYMTIGPCDQHWSDSNPAVLSFNESLRTGLLPEVRIIDMHAFISEGMANGTFATMDGVHYNYETSRAIYQHMMEVIEADFSVK